MSEIKKTEKKAPEKAPNKAPRMPVKKGRWVACVLYPDNFHQMDVLKYLKSIGQTMLYITHEPEEDEKKQHIHVMIHFDYPRTASGFCSAFGMGKFKKSVDGYEPIPDNVDCTDLPVLQLPILSHAEIVSSPADYYRYLLHQDFKSIKAGKKKYQISDITFCGNKNELHKLAYQEYQNYNNLICELMECADCANSAQELMDILICSNRYDLISYVQGHAYFVKEFFLHTEIEPKQKKKGGND